MGNKSSHQSSKERNNKTNKIPSKKDEKYYNLNKMLNILEYQEKSKIDPMILLKKEKSFACGLGDGGIKIYSAKSPYSLQIEMNIHSTGITCICETKKGELISGAYAPDSTIKLTSYNLKEKVFEIVKEIKGHISDVYNVIQLEKKFISDLFASCSKDKTIKIWNKNTGQAMLIYKNIEYVWCLLELSNYRIIFCQHSYNGLYEINYKKATINKKRDKIIATGTNALYKMKIENKNYIAIAGFGEIFIVDDIDYKIKNNFKFGGVGFLWSIRLLSDNSFLINGASNYIYQISANKGQIISKANIHNDSIPSIIELEKGILVTCSYDHKIKFWQLKK